MASDEIVVVGVPFDSTSSSRPGAALGPRAIRVASQIYSSNLKSAGIEEMLDTRTGVRFLYRPPDIVDTGDVHVYPTDTLRTFRSVGSASRDLARRASQLIFLNGDHSVTFATFAGSRSAWMDEVDPARIGFINIDHHFDYGFESRIHGSLYHGSNSRRISELPGMASTNMAFVGVGDVTKAAQYDQLISDGYHVVSASQIRTTGVDAALDACVREMKSNCDVIYVSLDVDVLDASVAPGTGNVSVGGLSAAELFDVFDVLRQLPVRAWDVAEMAPAYDPTGRTAQLMAKLLFDQMFRVASAR